MHIESCNVYSAMLLIMHGSSQLSSGNNFYGMSVFNTRTDTPASSQRRTLSGSDENVETLSKCPKNDVTLQGMIYIIIRQQKIFLYQTVCFNYCIRTCTVRPKERGLRLHMIGQFLFRFILLCLVV